jgi:hypothetical protein
MDAAADCEAPDAIYWVEEGAETMLWRRNGRRQVKFFNAFILGEKRGMGSACFGRGKKHTL